MHVNISACAFAIEIQIADVEILSRLFQMTAIVGIERPGQSKLRIVGNFQSVGEIFGPKGCQHWPEYLFLRDSRHRVNIAYDCRLYEPAILQARNVSPAS